MIEVRVPAPVENRHPRSNGKIAVGENGRRKPTKPYPAWMTANQRMHHNQRSKRTQLWRDAGHEAAASEGMPRNTSRWFVIAVIHLPRNVVYDAANYQPVSKAILDGIVTDYEFLPDDNNKHIVGPLCVQGGKASDGLGGVQMRFYDLSDTRDRDRIGHVIAAH